MVQLNTTYDRQLKEKIFVLKGDEGYARTTDVIATLITDFSDYDTHISTCHVGLEIEVLREFGDSHLHVYVDGEVTTIPWSHENMDTIIDSTWNERGVYWENGKLIIGKQQIYPSLIETGIYCLYDVEHTIKVKYDGNKQCLGSSDTIVFTVPMPNSFKSTLTFTSQSQRYAPTTEINDISVAFSGEHSSLEEKSVSIYVDGVYNDSVNLRPNDSSETLELTGLTEGLHTLTAVFDGDDEFYASQTEYQISIGYNIVNLDYSPYIIQGDSGYLSCTVLDYFNEPFEGLGLAVTEYIEDWGWETISQTFNTDGEGSITIEPVYYSSREFAISTGTWYSERHTTDVISPTSISLELSNPITVGTESTTLTGTLMQNDSPLQVSGIKVTVTGTNVQTVETDENGNFSCIFSSPHVEDTTITASVSNISASILWRRVYVWWSVANNKYSGTPMTTNVTISRKSTGFGFIQNSVSYGNVFFSSEIDNRRGDSYRFKVINKGLGTSKLYGFTFNELGIQNGDEIRVAFEQFMRGSGGNYGEHNSVTIYKNDSSHYITYYNDYPKIGLDLDIAKNDNNLLIDNLTMEKVHD